MKSECQDTVLVLCDPLVNDKCTYCTENTSDKRFSKNKIIEEQYSVAGRLTAMRLS